MYETVAELAARFRVSEDTAYDWVRRDAIPGVVRLGGLIRIDVAALEDFLRQGGGPRRVRRSRTRDGAAAQVA